ncbi:MAG: DUF1517 domain-containing protein [Pegethrix bostrychoides GSE-TBD4-15B]|uniref:DUF1517 domain-containing protein n=1 Tax=Pegethrix bostrychoides GSE-TBD4-15B TaxID=2839662 RepID=A0A951PHC6_9CYAN|nr:DUF1517 domain-containing protein [Pegethrix bostrychoides GSE-TBD4-15B]
MLKKLSHWIKPWIKPLLTGALVLMLAFGQAQGAWAASGGRIGGGSFKMPSRPMPSRTYAPPSGGGGYYPGGGFGYPFLIPSFGVGFGGSGLLSLLVFMAVAGFLVNTFRSMRSEDGMGGYESNPTVSVAKLQVGLLSEARSLQADLNRIAEIADTSTKAGLTQVLQETTLALLRHPEYWRYASDQSQITSLSAAENQFNRLAIAERSKFSGETLSNVNNLLKHGESGQALPAVGDLATLDKDPGEYIVVTLLVASQGKLQLPAINSSQDLRQAISQIGSASGESLLALEVLWTPQADGDTLSADDVLAYYPELKLV